jgi:hypothetical protein
VRDRLPIASDFIAALDDFWPGERPICWQIKKSRSEGCWPTDGTTNCRVAPLGIRHFPLAALGAGYIFQATVTDVTKCQDAAPRRSYCDLQGQLFRRTHDAMKAERRIQAGLIAFACGDAAGVPTLLRSSAAIRRACASYVPRCELKIV